MGNSSGVCATDANSALIHQKIYVPLFFFFYLFGLPRFGIKKQQQKTDPLHANMGNRVGRSVQTSW